MEKVKLSMNTLFAGIGAQEYGIKKSGCFELTVISTSEIDRDAVISYAAIHNGLTLEMIDEYPNYPGIEEMKIELSEKNIGDPDKKKPLRWLNKASEKDIKKCWLACRLNNNLGDICKIKELPEADLWTVSFPCQDISCAGKKKGLKKNSGTKSSLVWEQIRLLEKAVEDGIPPKYLLFENAKELLRKFKDGFSEICTKLSELGYNSYAVELDAQNYGVPQSRKRTFAIFIRKGIDIGRFDFPKPFPLETQLENILEKEAGEEYYIQDKDLDRFFAECVTTGALPAPNSTESIDVVRNEKWYQGRKGLGNNGYFAEEHIKGQESYLVGNCREFVRKHGYFPHIFVPKGRTHVKNHIARCLLRGCGSPTKTNTMVVLGILPMKDKADQDIRFSISRTAVENIRRLINNGLIRKENNIDKEEKK